MKYLISLDAGTTSVRAMLYDCEKRQFVFTAQSEVGQFFPQSGWVEQDAEEIFDKCAEALKRCILAAGENEIAGIGIANQRDTVVLIDRKTGRAASPAIGWQCRRTTDFCKSVSPDMQALIRARTGLPMDAYFSASKIKWLLENTPGAKELFREGRLLAGTIDSFLLYKLTGNFYTDHTNASRTMLFDIRKLAWDGELLEYFGIPRSILPEALPCTARMGTAELCGRKIAVAGVAGDQQAALLGQACLCPGEAKITYGTGLFLLFHTGEHCVRSESGLVSTIAYTLFDHTCYALEGSAFHAGSAVKWLRDGLKWLDSAAESEEIAKSVLDTGGVYFVPAFTGLGAPHWEGDARATFTGITQGTSRAHLVRAVLESIAYEAKELFDCMRRDSGIAVSHLKCDGGASANDFLMQFQSDLSGLCVDRPKERECTALGAAFLSGLSLGIFGEEEFSKVRVSETIFRPEMPQDRAEKLYQGYLNAVKRAILKV